MHLLIQISILIIADKRVGEVMKEQQCSIAKRMKYVALQDLQIRAVPRPVVHLIPGVIIITLPFMVYTPYIAITFIIKTVAKYVKSIYYRVIWRM